MLIGVEAAIKLSRWRSVIPFGDRVALLVQARVVPEDQNLPLPNVRVPDNLLLFANVLRPCRGTSAPRTRPRATCSLGQDARG